MIGGVGLSDKIVGENKTIISEECLEKMFELLRTIRYGSVTLVVQDGIVIQIERNEKIRFKKN